MFQHKRTTLPQYYWGIGLACSLIFLALAGTSALVGKIAFKLGSSEPLTVELSRATSPLLFGSVILTALALATVAVVATGRGLRKALSAENE